MRRKTGAAIWGGKQYRPSRQKDVAGTILEGEGCSREEKKTAKDDGTKGNDRS